MNPYWFDETVYMTNKLEQLKAEGSDISTMRELRDALQSANLSAYEHYLHYGDGEGLSPNAYLNRTEYLEAKAAQLNATQQGGITWDVAAVQQALDDAGLTIGEHFNLYGWAENVNPSNDFDVSTYLEAKAAQMGPGYTVSDLKKVLLQSKMDPVGHYIAFGRQEGLQPSAVPLEEQVTPDPTRPRDPILAADGKTLTIHMQSPLVTASIEKEDFSVMVGNTVLKVDKVESNADSGNYDLVITLTDDSRIPGLLDGETSSVSAIYTPSGGSKSVLTTEAGPVAAFTKGVSNLSQCFQIVERVTTESKVVIVPPEEDTTPDDGTNPDDGTEPDTPSEPDTTVITISTLNISVTPPANYVQSDDVTQFVKIDLSSTAGVVNGGTYGIVTAPRLMDGKLVQKLDTTAVDEHVRLNIVAGASGSEITTSDAADFITLGAGDDKVNYTSLTASQLSHMETIDKFTCEKDSLNFADASGAPLISNVIFKGPLSLEGQITEASIQGVFYKVKLEANTAYVLQNAKDFILVADANKDGVFTAADDFALQLTGVTGMPADVVPGTAIGELFL